MGQSVQFGYGVLDVKVTLSGTHITDFSVPDLKTAEPTSQQISEQAIPMLRSEVLSAQSANVNGISGATSTSRGSDGPGRAAQVPARSPKHIHVGGTLPEKNGIGPH